MSEQKNEGYKLSYNVRLDFIHDFLQVSIGNPGLSVEQAKAQFAMWAIWSALLLMSNDLRFIAPAFKEILLNEKVIAINQDPMGIMGRLVVNVKIVQTTFFSPT